MTNVSTKLQKKNRFWEILGKISLVIVIILGIIQLISIIKHSSGIKSTAYIKEFEYHSAPFVYSYIDTLIEKTWNSSVKSIIKESLKPGIYATDILDLFRSKQPDNVIHFRYPQYFAEITLKNVDKKELSNLVLNVPTKGYYKFSINKKLLSEGQFDNQINIGNLRTNQTMIIKMWNTLPISQKKQTSLSTETSVIKIKYSQLVYGVYAWLFNHPEIKFWFPWFTFGIVLFLISGYYTFIKLPKK